MQTGFPVRETKKSFVHFPSNGMQPLLSNFSYNLLKCRNNADCALALRNGQLGVLFCKGGANASQVDQYHLRRHCP